MDAHDYYRILEIRHAWTEGRADAHATMAELAKQRSGA